MYLNAEVAVAALAYIQQMPSEQRTGQQPTPTDLSGLDQAGRHQPLGFTAIGFFLFFGALMASLAAITLLWRGTALDRVWALNPTAYHQLAPLGSVVGLLFLVLAAAQTAAGVGWLRRRLWGWRLAILIIATQVAGDLLNFFRGDRLRGGMGFAIAGALLFYLFRPQIRACFPPGSR
jgi:hypothetical protein